MYVYTWFEYSGFIWRMGTFVFLFGVTKPLHSTTIQKPIIWKLI